MAGIDGPYGPPLNSSKITTKDNDPLRLKWRRTWIFFNTEKKNQFRYFIESLKLKPKVYGAEWLEDIIQRHKCNVGKCNEQSEYYLANSDGTESDNQQQICSDHYNAFKDITMTAQRRWRKIS